MARVCERCSVPLRAVARADARWCSTRCRVASHRDRRALPAELTSRDRWVRHDVRKVPLHATTGRAASSTNPATWSTFAVASRSTVGVGLGFALGDGIGCIDLDHCIGPAGVPAEWAQRILDAAPATFIEVSPSGDGLHIWGRLPEGPGRARDGVEVYSWGRYVTVTRRPWPGSVGALADLGELVSKI